jgi:hypothetical protein
VEHQLHERNALDVLRLDVLDPSYVQEVVLVVVRQVAFHLRRIHPAEWLRDVDGGCPQLREDVHLHLLDGHQGCQCNRDDGDHDRDRPSQSREH